MRQQSVQSERTSFVKAAWYVSHGSRKLVYQTLTGVVTGAEGRRSLMSRTELTCRSQANRVAPRAFGSTVICWNVSRSCTWMLFSAKEIVVSNQTTNLLISTVMDCAWVCRGRNLTQKAHKNFVLRDNIELEKEREIKWNHVRFKSHLRELDTTSSRGILPFGQFIKCVSRSCILCICMYIFIFFTC